MVSLSVQRETTFAFLFIPSVFVAFNIILCVCLSWAHKTDPGGLQDQASDMIALVTSTSIGIVTLTFSLTVLSIQIAAQTYSPRLLDEFLRDPVSKITIAVNLGAFSYGYTLTYFLKDPEKTPYIAIHALSVQMALVLLNFVYFIHHFINGFRLESILFRAAEDSWRAAQALEDANKGSENLELPEVPSDAYKVLSDKSGYVAAYRLQSLTAMAKKLDLCVRYHPNIGEFVAEGTLLAYVWDAKSRPISDGSFDHSNPNQNEAPDDRKSLKARVIQDTKRIRRGGRKPTGLEMQRAMASAKPLVLNMRASTMVREKEQFAEFLTEQRLGNLILSGVEITAVRSGQLDVLLGVQTLTDIAVKALSPAVNDPMTAIQVLDYLSILFCRLTDLNFAVQSACDSKGILRACAPRRSFAYLLSVLDSIRFYGGSDRNVMFRLLRFYGEIGSILRRKNDADRVAPVLAQLEQCLVTAQKHYPEDSSEYKAIREVYRYSIDLMVTSNGHVLKPDEELEIDVTDLETTYEKPTELFIRNLPKPLQSDAAPSSLVVGSRQVSNENF